MYRINNYAYGKWRVERRRKSILGGLLGGEWFPVLRNGDYFGEEWWDGTSFESKEKAQGFITWLTGKQELPNEAINLLTERD